MARHLTVHMEGEQPLENSMVSKCFFFFNVFEVSRIFEL